MGLSLITLYQGDLVTARTAASECRALAQATGDPLLAVQAPFALSLVEEAEGQLAAAARLAREAVETARLIDDPGILGWSLIVLGNAWWHFQGINRKATDGPGPSAHPVPCRWRRLGRGQCLDGSGHHGAGGRASQATPHDCTPIPCGCGAMQGC